MCTNFHKQRLNKLITNTVVNMASENQVDLNTINWLTGSCLQVGYPLTGRVIILRENPKGVLVECFKYDDKQNEFMTAQLQIDSVDFN